MSDILQFFISLIGAGITASLVTIIFERRQKSNEIAIKIAEDFINLRSDMSKAKGILQKDNDWNASDQTFVIGVVDWFELMTTLSNSGIANRKLLKKLGVDHEVKEFYEGSHKKYDPEVIRKWWPNLHEYYEKNFNK